MTKTAIVLKTLRKRSWVDADKIVEAVYPTSLLGTGFYSQSDRDNALRRVRVLREMGYTIQRRTFSGRTQYRRV